MSTARVYLRHFRAEGYCVNRGTRPYLKDRGVDWADFLQNGISADDLRLIVDGDTRAEAVIARAEAEEQETNGG